MGLEERLVKAMGLDGLSPEGNALMQELQQLLDSLVYKPDMRFTNLIDAPRQREYGNAHGFPVKVDFQNDEVVFADPDSYDPYEEEATGGFEYILHAYRKNHIYTAHNTLINALNNVQLNDPNGLVYDAGGSDFWIEFQEDGLYCCSLYVCSIYEKSNAGGNPNQPVYLDARFVFDETEGFDDLETTDVGPGPGVLYPHVATAPYEIWLFVNDTGDGTYYYPGAGVTLRRWFSVTAGDIFQPVYHTYTGGYAADGSPQIWGLSDFSIYRISDNVSYALNA